MTERELLLLRAQRVGVVVQGPARNLLPYGTAEDNIVFAQRSVRGSRRADLPTPAELLGSLDLTDLAGQVVGRLSGASRSGWRWPSRSRALPACCWPTSRPASSTAPTATGSSRCCGW